MTTPQAGVEVGAVYVHAPFCARRCSYCDFAVVVSRTGDLPAWAQALERELEGVAEEALFTLAPVLTSLYVGGGTPSLLGPEAMSSLADVLGRQRVGGSRLEWTAEANPESFTPEVGRAWASAGVNRMSLGAQSFDEATLRWMGRLHGADGPGEAVRAARETGIDNVSVDLIFGLPAHLERSWSDDLERVIDLDVPHVSLYGLTVEAGTPLGRAVSEGREQPVDESRYAEEYLMATEALCAAGYDHYEVSNFARAGARAEHNAVYWRGQAYLGIGNGAHSYAHPVRRWNVRDWETYRSRLQAGEPAEEGREVIDAEATRLEQVWLGLRTAEGFPLDSEQVAARRVTDAWRLSGLATSDNDVARLTPKGWLLLDRLAVELEAALRAG